MTFLSERSNIHTQVISKRKAEICTWKDRVRDSDIDCLIG